MQVEGQGLTPLKIGSPKGSDDAMISSHEQRSVVPENQEAVHCVVKVVDFLYSEVYLGMITLNNGSRVVADHRTFADWFGR